MAAKEESVPVFVRVKNTVRILAADPLNLEKNLAFIVQVILEEFGRVSRREILAIQDYPKKGIYDVTFEGEGVFRSFLSILEANSGDPRLSGFRIFPHITDEVFLVIKSYSPFVPLKEIESVLGRYCKKLSFVGKILNELGIWTSKYRFKAIFKEGAFPPARFRLGTVNIDCFFSGMPDFCRRCRQYGHIADGCTLCQGCGKAGHEITNCSSPKKCNFCFQEGHLYAACSVRKVSSEETVAIPGKSSVQAESASKPHEEEDITDQASQSGPKVKRSKEKKERDKVKKKGKETPDISPSGVSLDSFSISRGERLYEEYKDKTNKEISEILEAWSDEEEFQGIHECISKTPEKKDVRAAVLSHIRKLK